MTSAGSRARIAVFGAGGYTGGELVRLLLRHAHAEPVVLFGSAGRDRAAPIGEEFPDLAERTAMSIEPAPQDHPAPAALDRGAEIAMLCTPHAASAELAPALIDAGLRVIDLSGAFRVPNPSVYTDFYAFEHARPALLDEAVYGLPEFNRSAIADARLVAAPGCYPTASLLGLAALAGATKDGTRPIIDATSGVSGAGRSAARSLLFGEVSHAPYNVLRHRHTPEIAHHAGREVIFTPHVGPYFRGIVATMHLELEPGWDAARVRAALSDAYEGERFVRLLDTDQWPSVRGVAGTNFCDLNAAVDNRGHAIVVSAIDNLLKGAAGQAVQCLNLMIGVDETEGLIA
ncbi:MAG: N-acetyl-gamma-glutamyl-phosphate reductase [Planctomycetota bacterium]